MLSKEFRASFNSENVHSWRVRHHNFILFAKILVGKCTTLFRRHSKGVAIIVWAMAIQGCGVMGDKKPAKTQLTLAEGCFDKLGPSVMKFVEGNIAESEWKGTWNCATDSLKLFRTYAKGASDVGFSAAELKGFAETFLLTNKTITLQMVQAFFELKSSLFGGDPQYITKSELDLAIKYAEDLGNETARLIPFLKARISDPTLPHLRALSNELVYVAEAMAKRIPNVSTHAFSANSLQILLDSLDQLFNFGYPDHLAPFVMTFKALLVSGDSDSIDGIEWKKLLNSLAKVLGPVVAASSIPDAEKLQTDVHISFLFDLMQDAKPAIEDAIVYGHGAISYKMINQLIDQAPKTWLQMDRAVLKEIVQVFISRILQSESSRGMDLPAVNTIYSLVSRWVRGQVFIESFFRNEGLGEEGRISTDELDAKLSLIAVSRPANHDIALEIANLVKQVKPIYDDSKADSGSKKELTLKPRGVGYSLFSLGRNYLFYLISEHLVRVYSTDPQRKKVSDKDFRNFVDDIDEFLVAIHFTDRVLENDYLKRLHEADYFTFASNADGAVDIYEATYYLQYLVATSNLSDRIRELTEKKCSIGKKDKIGWYLQDVDCFRKEFYAHFDEIAARLPGLSQYFLKSADAKAKGSIAKSLEFAGRRYGSNQLPVGNIDITGMVGTLYFIETVFLRFDLDGDGYVSTDEAMKAVPVFGPLIASVGGIAPDQKSMIEAGFTYTLKMGHSPSKQKLSDMAEFLAWMGLREVRGTRGWNLHVARENVFGLLPVLAAPPLPAPPVETLYGE